MIVLTLPLPPSINTYWGFHGNRRFLTKKANEFKDLTMKAVKEANVLNLYEQRLCISIYLHFADKRKADIDNRIKSLLDALVQTKMLFNDDSQVDELHIFRAENIKGGMCKVFIDTVQN